MNLSINYEETRSIGNQIISKSEEFRTVLNQINNINGQIGSVWAGTDAQKYTQAVGTQAQLMNQLAGVINEIGDYLVKVSNAYETASQNNANSINIQ